MSRKIVVILLFSFIFFLSRASAQENEVGFVLGGMFAPDGNAIQTPAVGTCVRNSNCLISSAVSNSKAQVSFEGVYGRRILEAHLASLYVELPVVGVPSRRLGGRVSLNTSSFFATREDFSSIFITPSLKAKFLPAATLSPFISVGGGLAHYSASSRIVNPAASSIVSRTTNTGAFQIGGGVDIKSPIPSLGFRVEVQDFITGSPGIQFDHHQNLLAGGGVVFHF